MTDAFTRLAAALADRYRIERELGEGGMATVYLAEDLKHDRQVAIKVLKPELSAVVGSERFLAEIRTTANLQHPGILPLHDSGEADSFLFYVMPYVEGESLRDRLEREHQLPVDEAVRIATDVAEALEYAHGHGVIHRDVKPANILLVAGRPVLSDFGIALAVGVAGGGRLTETGLSLGTPHYMSPEQATGDAHVGPATDTYALGCVLYEMLTGDPPYTGSTAQAVLGQIIAGESVSARKKRPSVPANVDAAVRKALEKLPADRFRSAGELAKALADPGFRHGAEAGAGGESSRWKRVAVGSIALAGVLAVAFAGAAAWFALRPTVRAPTVRTQMAFGDIKPSGGGGDLRVAPNGAAFAVVFDTASGRMLAVREADESDFRVIPDAEWVSTTAFSPDGTWIAYGNHNEGLMKVAVSGGAPEPVIPDTKGSYEPLDWGADGRILFTAFVGDSSLSVRAVPSTGGVSTLILHGYALSGQFLPGGNVLLGVAGKGARFVDVAADTSWIVVPGAISPHFLPATNQLLWVDGSGALWAADFDPSSGSLGGRRGIVLEGVTHSGSYYARYDVSDQGTLVYSTGGSRSGGPPKQWLVTVAMDGSVTKEPLTPRMMYGPRWSPDGRFVAYMGSETEAGTGTNPRIYQIYTYDMRLESRPRRLTSKGENEDPVWSPDGSRLVFASKRDGTKGLDLFVKNLNDEESPRLLLSLPGNQFPYDWFAPDSILIGSGPKGDIWVVVLPPKGSADSVTAHPFFKSESRLLFGTLAPQHDLVAYESNTGGTSGIYVRTFPNAGAPEQITEGSSITSPEWSADGKTIYYWRYGHADSLWAARIDRGPPFAVLSNRPVLAWGDSIEPGDLNRARNRFVTMMRENSAAAPAGAAAHVRFFVVTNWFPELRARLAGGG